MEPLGVRQVSMSYNRALVVDDSKLARITLKKKLEQRGLLVDLAESAQQALDYLKEQQPDIIFMDYMMPGIDGFSATTKIKTDPEVSHIPVVMCSGKDGEGYREEARAIGAMDVLSKPLENERLDAILSAAPPVPVATAIQPKAERTNASTEAVRMESEFERFKQEVDQQIHVGLAHQREEVHGELSKSHIKVLKYLRNGAEKHLQELQSRSDNLAKQLESLSSKQRDLNERIETITVRSNAEKLILKQQVQRLTMLLCGGVGISLAVALLAWFGR